MLDAERMALKREAVLSRLRSRAAERRGPVLYYIGDDGRDDELIVQEVTCREPTCILDWQLSTW